MLFDFQIALDRNGGLHAVRDDVGELIDRANAQVARREKAGDFRFHQFVDDQAAVAVGVNQMLDHIRIGKPADEDEDGFGRDVFGLVGIQIAYADAVDFVLAVNLLDNAVPYRFDLRVMQVLFDQDLLRGEMVAAVNRIDLCGVARQEMAFFDRRVASADYGHRDVAEEGAVAGGADADAFAEEFVIAGDFKAAWMAAHRQDHRLRRYRRSVAQAHCEGLVFVAGDRFRPHADADFRAEALRVFEEGFGEIVAGYAVGEPWIIVNGG